MAQLTNIVPCSHQCFNSSCHLTWRDVTTNQHGLIVTFKCSKTIYCINYIFLCYVCQALLYGQFLGLPYSVCPVITVPLSSLKRVLLPIFIQRFLLLVSQMLRCFSVILFIMVQALGHSILGELIQTQGDWASDAYKAYLEFRVESKLTFAHQLCFAILSTAPQFHTEKLPFWGVPYGAELLVVFLTFCLYA